MELLLATGNAHKVAELRAMLAPLGVRVLTPDEVGGLPEVEEDGATFAAPAAATPGLAGGALGGVADATGGAALVGAVVLATPVGAVAATFEERTRGRILHAEEGAGGFGYDPLFLFTEPDLPQTGRCFATLDQDEKGAVSHRGRALRALAKALPHLQER